MERKRRSSTKSQSGQKMRLTTFDSTNVDAESSSGSLFYTPEPRSKRGKARERYFEDEKAMGAFDIFSDEVPEFKIRNSFGRSGQGCSTPKANNNFMSLLKEIPLSDVKKNPSAVIGIYPPLPIDEVKENSEIIFINNTLDMFQPNLTTDSTIPTLNLQDRTSNTLVSMNVSNSSFVQENQKADKQMRNTSKISGVPSYLRPTIASVNKANVGNISHQTLDGSPAQCRRLRKGQKHEEDKAEQASQQVFLHEPLTFPSFLKNGKEVDTVELIDNASDSVAFSILDCHSVSNIYVQNALKIALEHRKNLLLLEPREIIKTKISNRSRDQSDRNRVLPLRPWFGEFPIYKRNSDGLSTLIGTTVVQLRDRVLLKKYARN